MNMGLFDDLGDTVRDKLADNTGKKAVGFESSVCEGCPHRGTGPIKPCGLCGCPTIQNGTLDISGMVPEGCPRMAEHERQSNS